MRADAEAGISGFVILMHDQATAWGQGNLLK